MKIILPIIVILIIIIFIIIIFNNNIYFSEDFQGSYNQNTIEDLIPLSLVPYNEYLVKKSTEYEVIDVYKKVLNRSPNSEELQNKIYLTKDELNEELYNSYEYDRLIKIQDNLAINDIEKIIARNNLTKKIVDIYIDTYNKEPDERLITPLIDCYIHLRSNIFLFIVFIKSINFKKFEADILSTKNLTKTIILEIFDKYYNLIELKLLAEDKIKSTRGDIKLSIMTDKDINYNTLKTELNNIISSNITNTNITSNVIPSITTNTNNINVIELQKYFNTLTSNIEPFTNYKKDKANFNDIYEKQKVGNIFTILQ